MGAILKKLDPRSNSICDCISEFHSSPISDPSHYSPLFVYDWSMEFLIPGDVIGVPDDL